MRSKNINPQKDSTVILLIGDSVINGGNLTDQDSLASTLLENWLSQYAKRRIRVLNISGGSWGPDNAAAYLKEKGSFHADAMVLVCSSHDAYDNMEFKKVVGVHPQFPDRQVWLAWGKIVERGWQYLTSQFRTSTKINQPPAVDIPFNSGFADLKKLAVEQEIPLLVYLHPTLGELEQKKWGASAEPIIQFCLKENIRLIDGLVSTTKKDQYRDHIHYNEKGQKFLANLLFPTLQPLITN